MDTSDSRWILTVRVPGETIFESYWYGYGNVLSVVRDEEDSFTVTIDYGTDQYRCEYQAGRFWSGLYPADIEQVDS